jgi:hypothetical protein
MRPIDGDALRDKLQNLGYDDWNQGVTTTWAEAFYACADIVAEAPTIEPEPHWIPCSHELPDIREFTSKTVLCCDEYGGIYTATYNKLGEWHDDAEYADLTDVIAWMPLPDCYQEDI